MSEAARMLLGGTLPTPQPQPQYQTRSERPQHRPERPERQPRQKTKINNPLHTVFFYNIPYNVPTEEIRSFANQYGEIMNLHSVIESKGQAFATYYDIRNAEKAVADVQDKEFAGRKISSNFAFRPPNLGKKDQMPTSANVLVRATDGSRLSQSEVSAALKDFGEIRAINQKDNNVLVRFFDIRSAKDAANHTRNCTTASGKSLDMSIDNNADDESNNQMGMPPHNAFRQPAFQQPQYGAMPPVFPPYGAPPGYPQYPPQGFPYAPPQYGMPPPQYGMQPVPGQQPGQGQPAPSQYGMPGQQPPMYGVPQAPQYGMPQMQSAPDTNANSTNEKLGFLAKLVQKKIE